MENLTLQPQVFDPVDVVEGVAQRPTILPQNRRSRTDAVARNQDPAADRSSPLLVRHRLPFCDDIVGDLLARPVSSIWPKSWAIFPPSHRLYHAVPWHPVSHQIVNLPPTISLGSSSAKPPAAYPTIDSLMAASG